MSYGPFGRHSRPSATGVLLVGLLALLGFVVAGRAGVGPFAFTSHRSATGPPSTLPTTTVPSAAGTTNPTTPSASQPSAQVAGTAGADAVATTTSTTIQEVRGNFSVGDCVDFDPREPSATGITVPCSQPHTWEVTGVYHMPDRSGAPYPDAGRWTSLSSTGACHALAESYLE